MKFAASFALATVLVTSSAFAAASPASRQSIASAMYLRVVSDAANIRDYSPSEPPYGFYVLGNMGGRGFVPVGNLQGHGKLCPEGKDWLELSSGTFHVAGTATPVAPYVLGCGTGASFRPATREVTY